MAVAGRLVADVLDRVGKALQPGITTRELDSIGERVIRERRRRYPPSSACPGTSRRTATRCASPSTRRSSTASPASAASARARSSRSTPARSWTAGTATPHAPGSWVRCRSPSRDLVAETRARHAGRDRGGAAGQRAGRHLGRHRGRGPGARLRRRALVRGPRHRHRDARGAAGHQLPHRQPRAPASSPACAWPSSPCSRSAATRSASARTAGPWRPRDGSLAAHWEHTIAVTADGPRILTVNGGAGRRRAPPRPAGTAS